MVILTDGVESGDCTCLEQDILLDFNFAVVGGVGVMKGEDDFVAMSPLRDFSWILVGCVESPECSKFVEESLSNVLSVGKTLFSASMICSSLYNSIL